MSVHTSVSVKLMYKIECCVAVGTSVKLQKKCSTKVISTPWILCRQSSKIKALEPPSDCTEIAAS